MSRTVWKYPIRGANPKVDVQIDAEVVHVGLDPHGVPCVWATADPAVEGPLRRLVVIGTGFEYDEALHRPIGSFVLADLGLVMHLLDRADR